MAAATLQPTYVAAPPTAQATTYTPAGYSASTYNPTGYTAAQATNAYDPTQATNELTQAAQGQDGTQNTALSQLLAAQGISPGSSAAQAAMQNLAVQQGNALDPSLAAVQQYAAGLGQQTALANQSALNSAGQFNAGAADTAGQYNAGSLNSAGQFNAGATNTAGSQNASAANQMTLQNLADLLQSGEFNAGEATSANQNQASLANNDWLAQLQAELGLQSQGLSTAGGLAGQQAGQVVPTSPSLFSQITSGLTGAASDAAPFLGGSPDVNGGQPTGVTPGYYGRGGN